MKRISLTQGQFALVDDDDYEWLNQWKWQATWEPDTQSFYAARHGWESKGEPSRVWMHRQILGLHHGDKRQGDHINHDTLDQRKHNLRIVTSRENHWNRKAAKGYYWNKRARKYMARIMVAGEALFLGCYDDPSEARAAYLRAKEKRHRIHGVAS